MHAIIDNDTITRMVSNPKNVVMANGRTLSDASGLTPEQRIALGVYLVTPAQPGGNYATKTGEVPTIDHATGTVTLQAQYSYQPLADIKAAECARIDQAAGTARGRFVSPGALIEQEYRDVEDDARAYLAAVASDPMAAVPPSIADEATRTGEVADVAAGVIVARADGMREALRGIRNLRLNGKAAVQACTAVDPAAPTQAEAKAVTDAADAAVAALNGVVPVVTGS